MTPIGSITPQPSFPLGGADGSFPQIKGPATELPTQQTGAAGSNFGSTLDGLVQMVSGKEAQSDAITNQVMLGQNSNLHQSVIAMQEASVALSLMVQVRNKLVDSYQELMRMQV